MRLALGYKTGLPSFWPCHKPPMDYETLDLLCIAFPRHEIKVWHSDCGMFEGARCEHWAYAGSCYETTEESDQWLTAFGYADKDETRGHFVIGEPVLYGDDHTLLLVISVSVEEK